MRVQHRRRALVEYGTSAMMFDNGCGFLSLAHGSAIQPELRDFEHRNVDSLGFRGEALASMRIGE